MPDNSKKFHEFALKSILFKGRTDWYFCYLKTEKIAHVLTFLYQHAQPASQEAVADAARRASLLPGEIAHLAAGEVDAQVVLADLFSLLSHIRMLGAQEYLSRENCLVLIKELEGVAERLVRGSHPSPFLSGEDFSVPLLPQDAPALVAYAAPAAAAREVLKDKKPKGQNDRMSLILELVRKKKSVSIKDIAREIKGCSEKTIQRELNVLIEQGLVRREGERRWSVYVPA